MHGEPNSEFYDLPLNSTPKSSVNDNVHIPENALKRYSRPDKTHLYENRPIE